MFKRKSVLFTWALSYIFLLLLFVLFCFTLKFTAQSKSIQEYKNITLSLQEQANKSINEYFSAMQKRASSLSNDYLINIFATINDPQGADYYNLLPIQQSLKYEQFLAQEGLNIYVYSRNIEKVLSSGTIFKLSDFYSHFYSKSTLTENDFIELLTDYHYNELVVVEHADYSLNNVLMLTSAPLTSRQIKATIIQELSNSALKQILAGRLVLKNSSSALFDQQGKLVCAIGNASSIAQLEKADLSDIDKSEILLGDTEFWVQQASIQQIGWKIVTVLPMQEIRQNCAWITQRMWVLLIIFLIIGGMCSFFLLRINYLPLKKLKDWYPIDNKNENEYTNIEFAFENMRNDLERIAALQEQQTLYLQKEFLNSCLVSEAITDEGRMKQLLSQINVQFSGDWFAVMILEFKVNDEHNTNITREFFLNEFGETTGNDFSVFFLPYEENDIIILNFKDEVLGKSICEIVMKGLTTIASTYKVCEFEMCTSGLHKGLGGIYFAYLQASEILVANIMSKSDNDAPLDSQITVTQKYNLKFSIEQKNLLLRYINAKNAKQTHLLLENIFAANFQKNTLPLNVVKCLASDILTGVLRLFEHEPQFYSTATNIIVANLQLCHRAKTKQEVVLGINLSVDEIISSWNAFTNDSSKNKDNLLDKITSFTHDHFLEHSFSVSFIAEALDVNVAFLSKYFKDHTGIGLLNYINSLRINYAKSLMANDKITVTQAANKAGFDNANTFIRLFKKYEGMTPGNFTKY